MSETKAEKPKPTGLDLLRMPFPPHQISKLPKPTRAQTDAVRSDYKKGIRCKICGLWHHPDVVHLDYVGHAALTDRLLDCDLNWNWEPVAITEHGTPMFDNFGGMWIRLTVCNQTRLGYGHPDGKSGGDAIKEVIGDALRNAAMRFGAALDLWHKGDLHMEEEAPPAEKSALQQAREDAVADGMAKNDQAKRTMSRARGGAILAEIASFETVSELEEYHKTLEKHESEHPKIAEAVELKLDFLTLQGAE